MTNSLLSLVASSSGKSLGLFHPILAQAAGGGTTAQLQQSFNLALGIVFFFGFIWGVIKIWSGANALSKGDADGKMGIVAGIIIAGAAAIMGAFFAIFNISGATLTPSF
ncbi:MAG TPA: hypothetical protein VGZ93_11630 [Candidatus Methylacidiphilales bacterium]|jgi:hypothetical protein|nr:hypothetical protein [Candidatus Methylacidiphilales bacterium]